jgi:hypothetical protein
MISKKYKSEKINKYMRGKIGSHVGMMLSFAIFVTFIVFLYSIVKPAINIGENKNSILSDIEAGIIKNTSANLTAASVQLDSAQDTKNCVKLNLFFTVLKDVMPTTTSGPTVVTKNGLEETQPAYAPSPLSTDPSLMINRDGTGAFVSSVTVTKGGSGYDPDNPPTVIFSGGAGGGMGASADAIVSEEGKITSVIMRSGGRGYSSKPSVSFNAANHKGSDAVADATIKDNTFFKVYYSQVFPILSSNSGLDCVPLSNTGTSPGYTIASVTIDKYMFEKYIIALRDYYNANYDKLKENLKIPSGDEFWFNFSKSDGTSISPPAKKVQTTNVFSNDIPVQYVDPDANIQSGFINIRVW